MWELLALEFGHLIPSGPGHWEKEGELWKWCPEDPIRCEVLESHLTTIERKDNSEG